MRHAACRICHTGESRAAEPSSLLRVGSGCSLASKVANNVTQQLAQDAGALREHGGSDGKPAVVPLRLFASPIIAQTSDSDALRSCANDDSALSS